jgi:hypothetical protein
MVSIQKKPAALNVGARAVSRCRSVKLGQLIKCGANEIDNGSGLGSAPPHRWSFDLSEFTDRQLHQFVLGLKPIVDIVPFRAPALDIELIGSSSDLFRPRTLLRHIA